MMIKNAQNSAMQQLAEQLIARERAEPNLSGPGASAVSRVFDGLRRPLCTLAGVSGFRALLNRALALATAQVPDLNVLKVGPDASLIGLDEVNDDGNPESGAVFVAHLLELLGTLIGEGLVLRTVQDAWPDLTVPKTPLFGESGHDPTR